MSNKNNKVAKDLKNEFGDNLMDAKTPVSFLKKVEEDSKKDLRELIFDDEDDDERYPDFEKELY